METSIGALSAAAVTIGFLHTLCGPDHYIPFAAMSRVGSWSLRKTVWITILCGIAHVASSAVLGFIGVALGIIVFQLQSAESWRGDVAGWLLTAFGLVYLLGGVAYALRRRQAGEAASDDETFEVAEQKAASLVSRAGSMTPWVLFAIFLFGPCEPLIPLLIYPAAHADIGGALVVTIVFGVTTVATMTTVVVAIYMGTIAIRFSWAQRYGHALAGLAILACGLAVLAGL